MGMLAVTALVTFFAQRQQLWSTGKKETLKMAGAAVVDVLAPGLQYEETENRNHFLAKVEKILFPIADYTVQIQSYETDAESTLSYEMILPFHFRLCPGDWGSPQSAFGYPNAMLAKRVPPVSVVPD